MSDATDKRVVVIETLKQVKADLLILDDMMPGLRGIEVFDHIRDDPELGRIPVLFATARSPARSATFAARGVTDVIIRPFDLNELIRRARTLLESKPIAC